MRVLVTGASGFVGRHLVAALRGRLNSALVLARGGEATGAPDTLVGPADLGDVGAWAGWPGGLDAVVHLAALNPARSERPSVERLHLANVAGTAALAARAARAGVPRFVFASTANVHSPGDARPLDEAAALAPQSPYAQSKLDAEAALRDALGGSATRACILRPAPIYGPGGRGMIAALARLSRSPLPLPIGGLGARRSLLSVELMVDAVLACLDRPEAPDDTFLVADEGPLAPADMVRSLRLGRGHPAGVIDLPAGLAGLSTRVLGTAGPLKALARPFVLSTARLEAETGWRPGPSSAERLRAMAARGAI